MAAIGTTSLYTPLIFILILLPSITADPPSSDDSSENTVTPATNVSPTLTVVLIVFVALFFLSGVFFVTLRQIIDSGYFGTLRVVGSFSAGGGGAWRGKAADGLSRAAIELIPTYFYKDVKMHRRVGKGEIECAVCLTEFEDHETLRLLPKCSHVFHPDCVDPWLLDHATCPICRTVLSSTPTSDSKTSNEHVITIDNLVPVSPGSNHSRPSEPGLSAEDNTGPRLQTPDSTSNIDSRFTLVLPDEGAANSRWQLLRARSQTKGLRACFSWCGRVGLNRENNPDRVHALSASHLPSPLSDTVSGYASSS